MDSYNNYEITWGFVLVISIFVINIGVLIIVSVSRELWKPRHLWMAGLCCTDIFVGLHKILELMHIWHESLVLCVVQKATLGIPYVINMTILTLLSLDRFVAVRYPFFYSATVTNKHVFIAFSIVVMSGMALGTTSVTLGLQDPECRTQPLQLIYLTVALTVCSLLTLFFNSSVLRIAKRQLNAIYAQDNQVNKRRRFSVICSKCGFKNQTYVNTLLPLPDLTETLHQTDRNSIKLNGTLCNGLDAAHTICPETPTTVAVEEGLLKAATAVNLESMYLDKLLHQDESCLTTVTNTTGLLNLPLRGSRATILPDIDFDAGNFTVQTPSAIIPSLLELNIEITERESEHPPLQRTLSLPNIAEQTEFQSNTEATELTSPIIEKAPSISALPSESYPPILKRSKSLTSCQPRSLRKTSPGYQFFRNLHFSKAHMFVHVGRLFPSVRFAKTVLVIMIPMWVFILPIITIIPLHRECEEGETGLDCILVDTLWRYLLVHMRSVLPLQAILDTMIYACGSKEFKVALRRRFKAQK